MNSKNIANYNGKVLTVPVLDHEMYGEKFYLMYLESHRLSASTDIIPVLISERLYPIEEIHEGDFFEVTGEFRSYSKHEPEKHKLILFLFVNEIKKVAEEEFKNEIILDGYICKPPVYRETPSGKKIADILLAVNRAYGKSDYIPCIVWGRSANYVSRLQVGDRLLLHGRMQSRKYYKVINEEAEERTAYEISISRIEKIEEE